MRLQGSTTKFVDFFLPRLCLSCNTKLSSTEKVICSACNSAIESISPERLRDEFIKKFSSEKIISGLFSPFIFKSGGSLQKLLHELKYRQRFRVGNLLGGYLAEEIYDTATEWNINCIVPMPLHKLKQAERGYNQSNHIAVTLGKQLNIPVNKNYVKRIRFTESQTKLNLEERRKNISGAFKIKAGKKFDGLNVLILDDVITTGASVSELGKVILDAGATKVFASSVALAD